MKRLSFSKSVLAGFLVSVFGVVVFEAALLVLPVFLAFIAVAALMTVIYLVVQISGHQRKTGIFAIPSMVLLASAFFWVTSASTLLVVLILASLISVVRSIYSYKSLFLSLGDFMLTLASIGAAILVFSWHQSLFLSLWVFFLMQAVTAFIPTGLKALAHDQTANGELSFERARRQAELALSKMVNK